MSYTDPLWLRRHQVRDALRELRNTEILYMPNSGNAGDSLISTATMQYFRRDNITFRPIDFSADVSGRIVVLGGGGNFIPAYGTIRTAFEKFGPKAKRIILLPHTIRGNEDILSSLSSDTLLFCREIDSYKHVLQVNPHCEVALAHDMAFHLDAEELLDGDQDAAEFQNIFRAKLDERRYEISTIRQKDEMRFFRQDGESTGKHGDPDLDISSVFEFGVWPRNSERSSWCFLEAIRLSNKVATDRLHVSIGSALLKKPCRLYDNSYGKNAGVYEHSLRGWSTVEFAG